MRVTFLHCIAGGINFNAGDTVEIDDAEAVRLIAGGIAVPAPDEELETTEAPDVSEQAVKPTRRARRNGGA